jgi:hypothetical protein
MPLAEGLLELAAMAGKTVVSAAVTDAWETARRGVARLLGRGDPDRVGLAERRLVETYEQLTGGEGAGLQRARAVLEAQWVTRLADVLEDDPAVEADLRALVEQVQGLLSGGVVSAADHSVAAAGDVNITATTGGVAAGVVHGDVASPNPTSPGPVKG